MLANVIGDVLAAFPELETLKSSGTEIVKKTWVVPRS